MRSLLLFCCLLITNIAYGQTGSEKIILLRHSTGGNLFEEGQVADWFSQYNSTHSKNYQISIRAYPDTPYPWNNYPYDYWNLWINPSGPATAANPNIDTLAHLAQDYDVIVWKHCYPGADVLADTGSPSISSNRQSLENYRLQYRALRAKFDTMPSTIFIVWTLVPRHRLATSVENAARAKQFVNWVRNDWLTEDGNPHPNIFIFDLWGNAAEEQVNPPQGQLNTVRYAYERSHSGTDSHLNTLANQTIGPVFAQRVIDVMAAFYNQNDQIAPAAPGGLRIGP